jgi:hypothetical protein
MPNDFQVDTNEYLSKCDFRDVISLSTQKWVDIKKLKTIIYEAFRSTGINSVITHIANQSDLKNTSKIHSWFYQGEDCEILRAGSKGWQKGKLKINVTLEFIPDEPEETSPLDDVRQEIDRDN